MTSVQLQVQHQPRQSSYLLTVPDDRRKLLAVRWFWLSVFALFGAGMFSVMLVLARMPFIGEILPYADFFHTALVIHVNLSVLVWILAFAGVLFSLAARESAYSIGRLIYPVILLATVMLVVTGFLPQANPMMSNYIPVLEHPVFLTGLVLFGVGIGAQAITAMSAIPPLGTKINGQSVLEFGLNCAAISVVVALLAFIWSWLSLPGQPLTETYFELLFWGGGHVLQYTYTLLMMVCWLWLASVARIPMFMSERVVLVIFFVGLASIFVTPVIYLNWDAAHRLHREMFTWLMSFGGSLATFPLGLAIYFGLLLRAPESDREKSAHAALMTSLLLFGAGGVIGFMITGNNVTVPAHYHGCIVGVTLALMGAAYDMLPRLGFPAVNFRLARLQLWLYGTGQFMHILGLVWSGGYGVERKVAGAAQGLDSFGRVAGMGLMGLGGLVSAIGGFLFIVIAYRAYQQAKPNAINPLETTGE